MVLAAVRQNGHAIEYASVELKTDKEVVLAAVQQTGWALEYASAELQADKEAVLAAVQQNGLVLACAELKADKEVVLAAVQQNGWALRYASVERKADKEVVLVAVQHGECALQFVASKNLQIDTGFVLGVCRMLAGKKIQNYPTVHSWIRQLPSFQGKLALSLFTDATSSLDNLMEDETNRHMTMLESFSLR